MSPDSDPSRHLVAYSDGQIIFSQGDEGGEMYIIEDGQVEILLEDDDGDSVSLATLERGDFFGEMAVLDGAPRTATARSKGDCRVLPLRGAQFTEMLQRNPGTTLRIMKKLSGRVRELQRRLGDVLGSSETVVDEAAPAAPPPPPAARPLAVRLVHESGVGFELPDVAEALIGRPDSSVGRVPEIDLTPLDDERSVSRSHARLVNRDGSLFLIEETGTTNGTFANAQRLETGVAHEVFDGDSLSFGGVVLTLRVG